MIVTCPNEPNDTQLNSHNKFLDFLSIKMNGRLSISRPSGLPPYPINILRQVNAEEIATILSPDTEGDSHRSAAAWDAGLTAGLSVGCEVDGFQAWGGLGRVEQEAGGHTGSRNVAWWGAAVTAGWLR